MYNLSHHTSLKGMSNQRSPDNTHGNHAGTGPYDIGVGVAYGDDNIAPDALMARARSSSRFLISVSSWIRVQQVQQVARTQSDVMSPLIP